MKKAFDTLIIEGGGFKTAFTAGVTDAFMINDYLPFETMIGISGGSVALSYYMSGQYRYCINAMKILAKDEQFANYKRAFGEKGYLDIDYIATVASKKVPFDVELAKQQAKNREVYIVATNRITGEPAYLRPTKKNWIQCVIASSTLPFATKGTHILESTNYFDGGWSDPLPVEWAYKNGAKRILVIRTKPVDYKSKQGWADYFGSKYFKKATPKLAHTFESAHEKYNDAINFMSDPPSDVSVVQIAPKKFLKSGTYMYTKSTLMLDYRYGLDKGLNHLNKLRNV